MPSTGLRPLSATPSRCPQPCSPRVRAPTPTESPSATTKTTAAAAESDVAAPRLVLTYDGGLLVLDATTLEVVVDIALDGFNRVNPAGDDRHVLVSHTDGFRVLDTGVWSDSHGDHSHHYAGPPALTDVAFVSAEEGHVVAHDGTTALFFDGTGGLGTSYTFRSLGRGPDGSAPGARLRWRAARPRSNQWRRGRAHPRRRGVDRARRVAAAATGVVCPRLGIATK